MILKGGGGGLANLIRTEYLFSAQAKSESLFPEINFQVYQRQNIYFRPQHNFGKNKNKKNKQKKTTKKPPKNQEGAVGMNAW